MYRLILILIQLFFVSSMGKAQTVDDFLGRELTAEGYLCQTEAQVREILNAANKEGEITELESVFRGLYLQSNARGGPTCGRGLIESVPIEFLGKIEDIDVGRGVTDFFIFKIRGDLFGPDLFIAVPLIFRV